MACLQPLSGSAVAAVAISAHQQLDLLPKTKSNNKKASSILFLWFFAQLLCFKKPNPITSFFDSLSLVFCSTLVLPKTKSYNKLLRFFSSDFLLWLRHRLNVAHCFFFIFFLFFLLVFVDPCFFCGFPIVEAARSVRLNGACQVFFSYFPNSSAAEWFQFL